MTWLDWYNALEKPTWTFAPSTISLIWTILYPIILGSFGYVFVQAFQGNVPWRVAVPFAIEGASGTDIGWRIDESRSSPRRSKNYLISVRCQGLRNCFPYPHWLDRENVECRPIPDHGWILQPFDQVPSDLETCGRHQGQPQA